MKKGIVILALVMTALSFGQEGKYKVVIDGTVTHRMGRCTNTIIRLVLDNGSKVSVYSGASTSEDSFTDTIDKTIVVNDRINYIEYKGGNASQCENMQINTRKDNLAGRCETKMLRAEGVTSSGTITVEPDIEITPPDSDDYSLPTDHKVIIEATGNFPKDSGAYAWQYTFIKTPQPEDWITIDANYNGNYILGADDNGVTALDLFPNTIENVIGQEVLFRIKYCDDDTGTAPVLYKIIPSAPNYTDARSLNPKCIGEEGTATLYFDRQLRLNETITILTVKDDNFDPLQNSYTKITEFDESNGKFSYTLRELVGKYKVGIILKYGNLPEEVSYTGGEDHEITFEIQNPDAVIFDPISPEDITDLSCVDKQDGTITISASGGTGKDYQYQIKNEEGGTWGTWTPFTSPAKTTITNLDAATYQIQIRDGNACIASEIKDIDNDDKLDIGDPIIQKAVIKAPTAIVIDKDDATIINPTAFGFENSQIKVAINGGTPFNGNRYTCAWTNNGGTPVDTHYGVYNPGQGYMSTLHSIGLGTYTLTVTDKNGCTSASASFIVDEQPEPLQISFEQTDVSCSKSEDGQLIATVTGGVPYNIFSPDTDIYPEDEEGNLLSYYYYWKYLDNGGWKALPNKGNTVKNLKKGMYSLNVRDKNGISIGEYEAVITPITTEYILKEFKDQEVELLAPESLQLVVTKTPPGCYEESDGSATAKVSGGTKEYTYVWKNNQDMVISDKATVTGLSAGNYTITVTDANKCIIEKEVDITQPEPLSATFETTRATCGGSDGSATAKVNGGTKEYTYVWKNNQNIIISDEVTATSLPLGNYTVTVTDKNNCTVTDTVVIEEPDPITIESIETTRTNCGGAIGTAEIIMSGLTEPYTYKWSTGATTKKAENLSQGEYTVTVTDKNNCTVTDTVVIEEPDPITIEGIETTRTNCGGAIGTAEVIMSGLTAPYTYKWNTGATTKKVENLSQGEYTVTVTDKNNCTVTDTVVIEEPDPITIEGIETTRTNCGGAIGTAEVIMSGLTAPYTYKWNTGATTKKVENLSQGEYTVTVTDKNNCTVTDTVLIKEPEPIAAQEFKTTPGTCDDPNGSAKVIMSGDTGPYTYEWSTGAITQEITNVRAGKYFVVVTDANYCTTTEKVIIEEISGIEIDVTTHIDPLCTTSKDGSIAVLAKGGTAPYTYKWIRKETSEVIATTNSISELPSGTYVVEVNDAIGCTKIYEETLITPEAVKINLGDDHSICRGQSVVLDITIDDPDATYSWVSDTGYSNNTPIVELKDPGIYTATITTRIGCVGTDQVTVKVSDNPIDADFLYSTHSFSDRQVEVINTSNPIGERVEWEVSEGAVIVEKTNEKIILSFEESDVPKTYHTTLTSYNKNEECSVSLTKPIIIEPGQGFSEDFDDQKFIKEFLIFPNANEGDFTIKVNLQESSDVSVKIMNLMSAIIDMKEVKGNDDYELAYTLNIAPGIYLIVLETPHGTETRKLVVE